MLKFIMQQILKTCILENQKISFDNFQTKFFMVGEELSNS